ncbi:asparagine synthase (glutamine-hydrolyzing) [Thalassomonas sp. RHCl1]|uniref:asparagine synthase (glutamine-hydrolyzing) n=1 Tax=Thalassomonas sp. RHCl1 TaxID=2995320 RepID=UPI00248B4109|nr:asparagine synthase (glutamine-hydrolyzing) [Thalassomonas sp. RHCl1]
MCGIVFCYSPPACDTSDIRERFRSAVSALAHRGPDDLRLWFAEKNQAAIGHTRLAINDEIGGHQPMHSADGRLTVAVNGELYNNRDELENLGAVFTTLSDSEYLLHLIAAKGIEAVKTLDGEFSFAVWDRDSKTAYLGRDRHGIKPLFYCSYQGQILAASEIKALLAYGVPAKWEPHYLQQAEYFVQTSNQTFVEGIYSLPPGHLLKVSQAGVEHFPYLEKSPLEPSAFPPVSATFEQACTEFESLLFQAIDKRLLKDKSNQAYLSSGIDSSVITAIAARLTGSVNAYSIGFENRHLDESRQAQAFAGEVGVHHHIVEVNDTVLADNFAHAVIHCEMPVPNINVAAKLYLSKTLAAAGHKTVLTGEGADESLLGYGFFRQDLTGPYSQVHVFPQPWHKTLELLKKQTGQLPAQVVHALPVASILAGLRVDGENTASLSFSAGNGLGNARHPIELSQRLHYQSVFQSYNLGALADRTEMANGIEGRPPFLDNALVAFIHGLPVNYKFDGLTDKRILRQVARKFIPESYARQVKRPFIGAPASLNNKGPLAELFQGYFLDLAYLPDCYCKEKVARLYLEACQLDLAEQAGLDPVFMHLSSLMVLQKHFSLSL